MEKNFDDIKYFDIIQKYFDGEMSSDELSEFNKQLESDKELGEELILYKELIEGIKKFNEQKIRNKFKEIDLELDTPPLKAKGKKYKLAIYSIAASVAIIIGISFYNNMTNGTVALANKYWEEDRGIPTFMGECWDKELNEAMYLYKEEKYEEASAVLKNLRNEKIKSDTISYYSGVTEYKLEHYKMAIVYFKEVLTFKESVYKEKADYRLALSYLADGDITKAKSILHRIASSENHLYKVQAKKILKEIK